MNLFLWDAVLVLRAFYHLQPVCVAWGFKVIVSINVLNGEERYVQCLDHLPN